MAGERTAARVFDEEFLTLRAKVLEVAAGLDRLDRAGGPLPDDARAEQLRRAVETLLTQGPDRAERVQLLFSRNYDAAWRDQMNLSSPKRR